MRPVGGARIEIVQHDEMRQRMRHPGIDVTAIAIAVPPAAQIAVTVLHPFPEIPAALPARLHLDTRNQAEVEQPLIAGQHEQVSA